MSDFGAVIGVFNSASAISVFELIVLLPMFFLCKTKKVLKVKPISKKQRNSTSVPTTASTTCEERKRGKRSLKSRRAKDGQGYIRCNIFDTFDVKDVL